METGAFRVEVEFGDGVLKIAKGVDGAVAVLLAGEGGRDELGGNGRDESVGFLAGLDGDEAL